MSKEIHIIIRPDGSTKSEVFGACGKECDALARPIEEALGTIETVSAKPEYHQAAALNTQTLKR